MMKYRTLFPLTLLVLALGLVLAAPQSSRAQPLRDGATVTKTFELTVNGTPPQGEFLYVVVGTEGTDGTDVGFVHFCGQLFEIDTKPACEGNGTVYTGSITEPAGTTIAFNFERSNQNTSTGGGDPYEIEIIAEGSETLTADVTNSVTYTYTGAALPATGLSDQAAQAGLGAVAALVVLLSGLVLRRRAV
jgi:hypothetical protein